MERKSSIHISRGNVGYFYHNSREKETVNSIFSKDSNFCSRTAKEALEFYNRELAKRKAKYTETKNKKLDKNTITLMTAIVNLNEKHTKDDVKKVCDYLEQKFGVLVVQYALHRDEGYIDENNKEHINHHAHIEILSLDENGLSFRRKLTRNTLRQMQTDVAKILNMERGTDYSKINQKPPKRVETYAFKRAMQMASQQIQTVTKNDIKEEIKKLREKLKSIRAKRADYAKLEAMQRDLMSKDGLTKDAMFEAINDFIIEYFREDISQLEKENEELKRENEELKKDTKKLKSAVEKLKREKEALEQELEKINRFSKEYEEAKAELEKIKKEISEKQKAIQPEPVIKLNRDEEPDPIIRLNKDKEELQDKNWIKLS